MNDARVACCDVLIEIMKVKLIGIKEAIESLQALEKEHLLYIEKLEAEDKKQ